MKEIDYEIVEEDGAEIIDVNNIFEVLSKTEYANCQSAAAEIIDNSIDANASDILIELFSGHDLKSGTNRLNKIVFIDNGEGMSPGRLQHVLSIGRSIGDSNARIGRFGIGLKQASLYACRKFTVYTWKNPNDIYYIELDTDKYRETGTKKIPAPSKYDFSSSTRKDKLYSNFKEHGTAVVWENFRENIFPAKPETLATWFNVDFSIKYRKFIDKGLKISTRNPNRFSLTDIRVHDMLFLSENNEWLGDPNGSHQLLTKEAGGEPLFEPFNNKYFINGECTINVPYDTEDLSKLDEVIVRATVIKEKFYWECAYNNHVNNPGNTKIGKYLGDSQERYISIVRNGREIDHGNFGFYKSINKPEHRWFRFEIEFTHKLDDVFNVSNNKQKVDLSNRDPEEYTINDVHYPIWKRLEKIIKDTVIDIEKRNSEIASYYKSLIEKNNKNQMVIKETIINSNNDKSKVANTNYKNKENINEEIIILEDGALDNFLLKNDINIEVLPNIKDNINYSYSLSKQKNIIIINEDYYKIFKTKESFKYILLYVKHLADNNLEIKDNYNFIKVLEKLGE